MAKIKNKANKTKRQQKTWHWQMPVKIQRIWNSHILLKGLENGSDTLENALEYTWFML